MRWAICSVLSKAVSARSRSPATAVIDAIIDTGPLVGALDRDDQWHAWATKEFAGIRQPALTCDAVISEACFLLRGTPDSREKIFALIERGIVHVVPVLPDESAAVDRGGGFSDLSAIRPTVTSLARAVTSRMDQMWVARLEKKTKSGSERRRLVSALVRRKRVRAVGLSRRAPLRTVLCSLDFSAASMNWKMFCFLTIDGGGDVHP